MSAILKFDFEKENNYVFWSKLSKLHKKDPILHVATTFSIKQGETRTSHGPIPHPLILLQLLLKFSPWIYLSIIKHAFSQSSK